MILLLGCIVVFFIIILVLFPPKARISDRVVGRKGSVKIYEDKDGNWYFFDNWGNKVNKRDPKKGY